MKDIKIVLDANAWIYIVIKVILIVVLTIFIAKIVNHCYKKKNKNTKQLLFKKFVHNIIMAIIYVVGFSIALSTIPQLSTLSSTILAGSGILALALSLSAQESLNNIISGLFITLFKPFEVGDRVTLVNEGITGNIEDITLRHTIIRTFTNTRIVIPNSVINKDVIENSDIINKTASSFMDVDVAYNSDIEKAMQIIENVISSHPAWVDTRTEDQKRTDPKVRVFVREFKDSGISLRANVWTKSVNENFLACSEIRLEILKQFREKGIEIPYKKLDLYIKER